MQTDNIAAVAQMPATSATSTQGTATDAANWQATLSQVEQGTDTSSQPAQNAATQPVQVQQGQTVKRQATSQDESAQDSGESKATPQSATGTSQTDAATEKLVQQRRNIVAAAAEGAQVTTAKGKTQDKNSNTPNLATAAQVAPSVTPATTAVDGKAAQTPQADAQDVAQVASRTMPQAVPQEATQSDAVASAADSTDTSSDTVGNGAVTDGTTRHAGGASFANLATAAAGDGQAATGGATNATSAPVAGLVVGTTAPVSATAAPKAAPAEAGKVVAAAVAAGNNAPSAPSTKDSVVLAVQNAQPNGIQDDAGSKTSATTGSAAVVPVSATGTMQNVTPGAAPNVVTAASGIPTVTDTSAAGLAATVTALHQAGQSNATLRLDPPGLGALSVHVTLGQQGQVNVLFVPSTQAAGTALQSNLPGLGAALAQSGLTLGQAQVGGQFNQNAGQGGQQGGGRNQASVVQSFEPESATQTVSSGVNAYA